MSLADRIAPALFAMSLAIEILQKAADSLQLAGLVADAGRLRGISEALTAERAAVKAEAEKRVNTHG